MKSQQLIQELLATISVKMTDLQLETQNSEYEGFTFIANNHTYRSRLAKITPKKVGYFVTFWEKDVSNKNQAYSYQESPDSVIITIIDGEKVGQFLFPKEILLQKSVLRYNDCPGKMAIRVYPTWVTGLNATARKTQKWQSQYFIDLSITIDSKTLKSLYFE
ncbi:MepB family protein [Enterococcus faecalis]|uniref:MepB family protein n=1 Tax=Enterococcus faecalis TaxID=1351 RepID=UPI002DBD5940|nr:MepB family protein [Enterococcus faecalis]MEB7792166.1 MepB family protein [Enterococcus faecalis]MEB7810190.1 MepB family protein [Enterococcus faecalis]